MLAFKLAIRNLIGAGLRTWLNVSVLSFAFVVIVFYRGLLDGWYRQGINDTINWEIGNGQYWHPAYDRYDIFTLQDSHAPVTGKMSDWVREKKLTPVLIIQATLYPEGRMVNALLRGLDPEQQIVKLPTEKLQPVNDEIPAIIGKRMAESARLKEGDRVLIRWRDVNGTFDAREVLITCVFKTDVPSVDLGQVYIPLETLRQMTGMTNEATLFITAKDFTPTPAKGWKFMDKKILLKEFDDIIAAKKTSTGIIYFLLLCIALLAIFDTQVLSIFRRQREIGTYMALGMTRWQIIRLFTIEGSTHSLLALLLGALYGIPILYLVYRKGIPMPGSADQVGVAISESIIPYYSIGMIISTVLLVIISATIVSFFPTRRISRMKPTDAIKGKIQ